MHALITEVCPQLAQVYSAQLTKDMQDLLKLY